MEKNVKTTSKNKFYISLLSVISAFSVVFLHTNGCFWTFSRENYWFLEGINECFFYFAVPVFLMLTGATLFNYAARYSTLEYFKRRISKTVVPFLFWSLFGLFFSIYVLNDFKIGELNFWYIIDGILNVKFVEIYWFFIKLFKIYAVIPLFANLKEKSKNKILVFLFVVMLLVNSVFPFVTKIYSSSFPIFRPFVIADKLIIFCIIGYLADIYYDTFLKGRKTLIIFSVLGISAFCCHFLGTYFLSMEANKIVTTFKGYDNILCIIYSFWIYLLVRKIEPKLHNNRTFKNIIEFLAKYTLAIYLLHIFVLNYIVDVFNPDMNAAVARFGLPFVIIPICVLIAYILRQNKFLAKIIP